MLVSVHYFYDTFYHFKFAVYFVIVFVLNNKQSNNNKCYFDIIIIN